MAKDFFLWGGPILGQIEGLSFGMGGLGGVVREYGSPSFLGVYAKMAEVGNGAVR